MPISSGNYKIIIAAVAALFAAPSARADEFLGVEKSSSAPAEPKSTKAAPAPVTASTADDSGGGSVFDNVHLSGGLAGSLVGFNAELTVAYYFNRYVSIDTTGRFTRLDGKTRSGDQYGPEVDLVLRGANPTIATPFFGSGPGYTQWTRIEDGETLDRAHSWTGSVFGGLGVKLARHFGLVAERRRTAYFNDPPRAWGADGTGEREPRYATSDSIGFGLNF